MSFWDFFGLFGKGKKDAPPQGGDSPRPAAQPAKAAGRAWKPLLAADVALICGSLGLLGWRVVRHMGTAQAPAAVAARPAAKPAAKAPAAPAPAQPAAKPEPPKPVKPEPPKPAKPEPPKPAKPEPPKPAKAEPAKPEPKPAAKAAQPDKTSAVPQAAAAGPAKAIPKTFSYANPAASHVTLLGSFLVRTGGRKLMIRAGGGKGPWECTLYLNPGASYRFRYEVVDKHGHRTLTKWETLEVQQ